MDGEKPALSLGEGIRCQLPPVADPGINYSRSHPRSKRLCSQIPEHLPESGTLTVLPFEYGVRAYVDQMSTVGYGDMSDFEEWQPLDQELNTY